MVITHPNFKSIDPRLTRAEDIDLYVGDALASQHKFNIYMNNKNECEFIHKNQEIFKINLEQVDRLYYCSYNDNTLTNYETFEMVGRTNFLGHHIFFHLQAECDYDDGFDSSGGQGNIDISSNALHFLTWFDTPKYPKELMEKSIKVDGLTL